MPLFRPKRKLPGFTQEQEAALYELFSQSAQDITRLSTRDASIVVKTERVDLRSNQFIRISPPARGQTLVLPPPNRTVPGDKITVIIESPVGQATFAVVPDRNDTGQMVQGTINGHVRVFATEPGEMTFTSNGADAWVTPGQFASADREATGSTTTISTSTFVGLAVLDDGTVIMPEATLLNFVSGTGTVATVADAGSGQANVTVSLAPIADDTFLGNISGGAAAPSAITFTSFAGDGLSYDATNHHFDVVGSTSITITSDQVQRAALTGAIEAALNSNATLFSAGASGDGLTGGGTAVLNVGAGTHVTVNANDVAVNLATLVPAIDSPSVVADGTVLERAALTGAISAAQDSNATLFAGIRDNGAAENDRTNLNFVSGTKTTAVVTDDAANDELEVRFNWNGLEIETQSGGIIGDALNLAFLNGVNTAAVGVDNGGNQMLIRYDVDNFPLTGLADQADDTFLANISGGSAPPTAVTLTSFAGDGLVYDATNHHFDVQGSTSITITSDQVQRAALTGDITATLNSNATAFRTFTTGTFLANITAGSAVPTEHSLTTFAGAGLTYTNVTGIMAVGAGTYITVNANDVAVNRTALSADLDSTSVIDSSGTLQRAALTGAIAAAQNSNATVFAGIRDNGAAENDRTNLNFVSSTSATAVVTDDAGNDELEVTFQRAALTGAIAASANANATVFSGILNNAVATTDRTNLNFVGFTITDDAANDRIVITAPAAGTAGHIIENNGTPLTQRGTLNFNDSTHIFLTASDDGVETDVTPALQLGATYTWTGVHTHNGASHNINASGVIAALSAGNARLESSAAGTSLAAGHAVPTIGAGDVVINASSGVAIKATVGSAAQTAGTGDISLTADSDVTVSAGTSFRVTVNGTERLEIESDGAWQLAGNQGTSGQILTSAGASAPPTWSDSPLPSSETPLITATAVLWHDEDFGWVNSSVGSPATAGSGVRFSAQQWRVGSDSSTANQASVDPFGSEVGHAGMIQLSTSSTVNRKGAIWLPRDQTSATVADSSTSILASDIRMFDCWILIPTITSIIVMAGIGENCTNTTGGVEGTRGCSWLFQPGSLSTWFARNRTGGSSSGVTNSGVTVVANQWYRLSMIWDGTSCHYYVNRALSGSISSNLPSGSVCPYISVQNTGGTARSVVIDRVRIWALASSLEQ